MVSPPAKKTRKKPANAEWRTDVCVKVKGIPISDKQPEREMLDNLLAWG